MSTFAETANVDDRLSFADHGKTDFRLFRFRFPYICIFIIIFVYTVSIVTIRTEAYIDRYRYINI